MGYTTVFAGTDITAALWNANVRDQSVSVFISETARNNAITSPVEGMVCATTDTDRLWVYTGTAWIVVGHYGPPTTWTPTITQSSVRAGTVNYGAYQRHGRLITAQLAWTATVTGSAAPLYISYPAAAAAKLNNPIGTGFVYDGTSNRVGMAAAASAGIAIIRDGAGFYSTSLAAGHVVGLAISYFAAS